MYRPSGSPTRRIVPKSLAAIDAMAKAAEQ
jgi:hypothetical protein